MYDPIYCSTQVSDMALCKILIVRPMWRRTISYYRCEHMSDVAANVLILEKNNV